MASTINDIGTLILVSSPEKSIPGTRILDEAPADPGSIHNPRIRPTIHCFLPVSTAHPLDDTMSAALARGYSRLEAHASVRGTRRGLEEPPGSPCPGFSGSSVQPSAA